MLRVHANSWILSVLVVQALVLPSGCGSSESNADGAGGSGPHTAQGDAAGSASVSDGSDSARPPVVWSADLGFNPSRIYPTSDGVVVMGATGVNYYTVTTAQHFLASDHSSDWTVTFPGAYATSVNANSSYVALGVVDTPLILGSGTPQEKTLEPASSADSLRIFVAGFQPALALSWATTGSAGAASAGVRLNQVAALNDGGALVKLDVSGPLTWGSGSDEIVINAEREQLVLLRLDKTGQLVWSKRLLEITSDTGWISTGMGASPDGSSVVVVNLVNGVGALLPGADEQGTVGTGSGIASFAVRVDPTGSVNWIARDIPEHFEVAVDADAAYAVGRDAASRFDSAGNLAWTGAINFQPDVSDAMVQDDGALAFDAMTVLGARICVGSLCAKPATTNSTNQNDGAVTRLVVPRAADTIRGSVLFATTEASPVYAAAGRAGSIWLVLSLGLQLGDSVTIGNGPRESGPASINRIVELQDR
jgi:hypothetical protein